MTMREMQVNRRWPKTEDRRYVFSETLESSGTSDPLRVPAIGRDVGVSVSPDGAATVEYTLSSADEVISGTAEWHEWPHGEVISPAADVVSSAVTALRLVGSQGSSWRVSA